MIRSMRILVVLPLLGIASGADAQRPPAAALAQVVTSLTGTARDDSGTVLPGVQITLTQENIAGAEPRRTTTDQSGRFRFTGIPVGTYRIEAVVPGFTRVVRTGIELTASQSAPVSLQFRRAGQRGAPPPPPIPAPAPPPPPPPQTAPPPPAQDAGKAVIPVFFATDRERLSTPTLDYGATRNGTGTLALGRCDVKVPRDHQMGSVERPTIWTLWKEDPDQHFIITSRTQQSYEDFYKDIRRVVDRSTRKDAFVFIHGFNVAFEDAVFRTAQIAYDLGFDGAPILYSWPSNTGENPVGYTSAQNNNDWTVSHLDWFLRDVTARTGATRIHLIAHSLGNRALVNALNRMPPPVTKRFNQIVLTAPDMDAQTFVQLADAVTRNGERTTLYASASDKALVISKQLNAYPRAGDTGPGVVIVPGIDTVDVTAVDSNFIGHFYYGDNRSVVSDIFLLLTQGLPPTNRPMLRADGVAPKMFWRFVR